MYAPKIRPYDHCRIRFRTEKDVSTHTAASCLLLLRLDTHEPRKTVARRSFPLIISNVIKAIYTSIANDWALFRMTLDRRRSILLMHAVCASAALSVA